MCVCGVARSQVLEVDNSSPLMVVSYITTLLQKRGSGRSQLWVLHDSDLGVPLGESWSRAHCFWPQHGKHDCAA